jgi:hypothetical protein
VDVSRDDMGVLLEVTSKDYMSRNISWISPDLSLAIAKTGQDFFRGVKQGWREFLSEREISRYQAAAAAELGEEFSSWLEFRPNA